jgi:hypothetical protein
MITLLFISITSFSAEKPSQQSSASYVPSLGDMMAAIQLRHAKIWYAAKLKNWDLADYELRQLEANLNQALPLYPSKPASDADASYKAVVLISEFLKAKDDAKFMQAIA